MNIEGTGPMRLVIDDRGTIRGIWVEELEHAQLNDSFKPRLRTFIAGVQASGEHNIPVEVYAAAAEGDFRVEKNSPSSGGGFFLMLHTGPGSVYASVRGAEPKKLEVSDYEYWQCPKCGGLLKKGFGTLVTTVIGTGTCSGCGAKFPQQDIYGGLYDVEVISFEPCTIRQIGPGLKRKKWWQFWK